MTMKRRMFDVVSRVRSRAGVTLTELLMAVLLGGVALFGLVAMYESILTSWSVASGQLTLQQEASYTLSWMRDYLVFGYEAEIKNREGRHRNELRVRKQYWDEGLGRFVPEQARVFQHVDEGLLMLEDFDGDVEVIIPSYIPNRGYNVEQDSGRAWVDTVMFTDVTPPEASHTTTHIDVTLVLRNLYGDRVKMVGGVYLINQYQKG
jgi:hypothetical protein